MKTIVRNLALMVALGFSPAIFPKTAAAQDSGNYPYGNTDQQYNMGDQSQDNNDDVYNQGSPDVGGMSYQNFYNQLSPYGRWIYDPTYGYVWVPNVSQDFMPYSTAGHWDYTDYGWTWASDYAWGWAPFHYGRWDYNASFGWYWVPGTVWGPAWVSWRSCDGYYGWAPLGVRFGFGYAYAASRWTFCGDRYFGRSDAYRYYCPRGYNNDLFYRSSLVRNVYRDNDRHATYFSGPRREEVERARGERVHSMAVRENERPNFNREQNSYQRQNNNYVGQNHNNNIANRNNVQPQRMTNSSVQSESRNNVPQQYAQRQSYNAIRQNNSSAPRQSYSAPRQNSYNAPRQAYSAPRQNYNVPRQNVQSAPRQSYSAPRQSYSAPRQSFASHSSGNSGRSSGGYHSSGGGGGRSSR